jgi:hypothetical protein
MNDQAKQFDEWCIVELFGHQRLAGKVSEQSIGGAAFIRVDVPKAKGRAAMTRFFTQGAIYSMTPVVERVARAAADNWAQPPVNRYDLALPAPGDKGGEET